MNPDMTPRSEFFPRRLVEAGSDHGSSRRRTWSSRQRSVCTLEIPAGLEHLPCAELQPGATARRPGQALAGRKEWVFTQTMAPGRLGAGVMTPFNPEGIRSFGFSSQPPVSLDIWVWWPACGPGALERLFRQAARYPQGAGPFQQERQGSSVSTLEVYLLPSTFST